MNDTTFRGRVKVGLLAYAQTILNEPTSTPAHNTRYNWAQQTEQQPDTASTRFTPGVVLDPAVQSAGDTIDDTALQASIQAVVNAQL